MKYFGTYQAVFRRRFGSGTRFQKTEKLRVPKGCADNQTIHNIYSNGVAFRCEVNWYWTARPVEFVVMSLKVNRKTET